MSELSWSVIRSRSELGALQDEWLALHRASGTGNPFSHPAWVTAWLEHYVAPDDLHVVTARDEAGALVAVAPFHRRGGRAATCLRLAGMGSGELLTEAPAILLAPAAPPRPTLRALLGELLEHGGWDWIELVLSPRQGWFEPEWLGGTGARFTHHGTHAFVTLELPEDPENLRSGMKRNLREAVRRGRNRLGRLEAPWTFAEPADEAELRAAIDALVALHRMRATVNHGRLPHFDYLQRETDVAFLRSAALAMFRAGAAGVPQVRIGDEPAAARLVLRANDNLFLSISGLDPEHWDLGLGTQIQLRALETGIAGGARRANLAASPDGAKLRWSEQLELHQVFMVVAPGRAARARAAAYVARRALVSARRVASPG